MYFTSGGDRAFESLMQGKPGFDHYDSGDAGAPEDCGDCRFYRPDWKYQFCVYAECPYQPGKLTALDAVKFQVKGVDDEMAVFRVEKNRGYTVMSNHHLRNKDLSLKAKGLLSQKSIENRESESARAYGRYQNVFLTDEELADLQASFPTVWGQYIEKLSEYMASTGKRYQSHAATIRRWADEDAKKAAQPTRNRDYSVKEDETV